MTNTAHAFSIDTKIDDLGWPWTLYVWIFQRIYLDFGRNSSWTTDDRPVLSATTL